MPTLTIEKHDNIFIVGDKTRGGSPPVGKGRSIEEALGSYIINNQCTMDIAIEVSDSAKRAERRRRLKELGMR